MNTHHLPALRRLTALAVLGVLLTVGASLGRAQITIYDKFADGTGVWAGESTDAGRTGWTNLDNVNFGATNPGGGGVTAFDSVVIVKKVDRLSPQIFATLASGTQLNGGAGFPDVNIEFVKVGAAGPVTFFRVELRLASFSQQSTAAGSGDDALRESVTLKNVAFRFTYWTIQPNGSQGASVVKSWSTSSNAPTFTP